LELLCRWFWRSTIAASALGFTGSTRDVRTQAGFIQQADQSASVQRLLRATLTNESLIAPDLASFRTNHSAGKVVLAAMWSLNPVDPETGVLITRSQLARVLDGDASPAAVALEICGPAGSHLASARNAANRVIAVQGRQNFISSLTPKSDLQSLLLDVELLALLEQDLKDEFLAARADKLRVFLEDFIGARTREAFELTPPLSEFDLDSDDELNHYDSRY
jgi:hypothetical protein